MQLNLFTQPEPACAGQTANPPESRASGAPVDLTPENGFYLVEMNGARISWLRPGSRDYRGIWATEMPSLIAAYPHIAYDIDPRPRREYSTQAGYVYFVQRGDGGSIKIGFTSSWQGGRIPALETASDVPLRVLAFVPGGRPLERDLHREFAADRLRREWFRPTERLLARIAALSP